MARPAEATTRRSFKGNCNMRTHFMFAVSLPPAAALVVRSPHTTAAVGVQPARLVSKIT